MEIKSNNPRLELLDVFRGLSIIAVIMFHYTAKLSDVYLKFQTHPLEFGSGYLGVQSFFVISGFCIYLTISRSRSICNFFAKRFARLWPALIVCALTTQVIVSYFGLPGREIGWSQLPASIFMLNDLGIPWVDGAYWSLLIEVKYYIIFAILFYAFRNNVFESLLALFFISAIFVMASRHWAVPYLESVMEHLVIVSHMPWFILGVAFYAVHTGLKSLRVIPIALATVICAILMNDENHVMKIVALVLTVICFMVLLRYPSVRIPYVFRYLGLISFPLYLLHQYIGFVLIREFSVLIPDTYLRLAVVSVLVIVMAHVVHLTVEFRYRGFFETGFMRIACISVGCMHKLLRIS